MTDSTAHDAEGKFQSTIDHATKAAEAAQLRAMGFSYREIARQQGIDVHAAHDRVKKAIAAVPVEAVNELRRTALEQLDMLTVQAYTILTTEHPLIQRGRVVPGVKDVRPKLAALTELRRLNESKRALLGLDAPQQHKVTVSDSLTAEIERLAQELGVVDPTAPLVIEEKRPPA